jgi:hypothetical protein
MPSQSSTVENAPLAVAPPADRQADEHDVSLRTARSLAIGAWIVVPIVTWGGIILAVVLVLQRLR